MNVTKLTALADRLHNPPENTLYAEEALAAVNYLLGLLLRLEQVRMLTKKDLEEFKTHDNMVLCSLKKRLESQLGMFQYIETDGAVISSELIAACYDNES